MLRQLRFRRHGGRANAGLGEVSLVLSLVICLCLLLTGCPWTPTPTSYTLTAVWGSDSDRVSGDGWLFAPASIAIDAFGNIYVADYGNARIQTFDSSGVFLWKWDTTDPWNGEPIKPTKIALDDSGSFYIVDRTGRVRKFGPSREPIDGWAGGRLSGGDVIDIALDTSGNLYETRGGPIGSSSSILRGSCSPNGRPMRAKGSRLPLCMTSP
jgi:hypothetical protein